MKQLSLKGKSITKETSKNNIRCMYAYVGGTVGFTIAKSVATKVGAKYALPVVVAGTALGTLAYVAISNMCIKDVENG